MEPLEDHKKSKPKAEKEKTDLEETSLRKHEHSEIFGGNTTFSTSTSLSAWTDCVHASALPEVDNNTGNTDASGRTDRDSTHVRPVC